MSVGIRKAIDETNPQPGEWYARGGPPAFQHALVRCPGCGGESTLSKRVHDVAPDGSVTPSYVCPFPPCTFHEWVRLEGWTH